ncbi:hypothetical protein [Streptomyces chartreusis]
MKSWTRARVRKILNELMPIVLDVNGAILVSIGIGLIYGPAGIIVGGIASIILAKHFFGGG